jgi:hypothetical protein
MRFQVSRQRDRCLPDVAHLMCSSMYVLGMLLSGPWLTILNQTEHNFHRALIWTAVMTSLSHLDPAFSSVWAIEAVNEPIMDATQTPGYGDFQKNFVQVIRAVELALGIHIPNGPTNSIPPASNFTMALKNVAAANVFNAEVRSVLLDAVPVLLWATEELLLTPFFTTHLGGQRTALWTK